MNTAQRTHIKLLEQALVTLRTEFNWDEAWQGRNYWWEVCINLESAISDMKREQYEMRGM